MTELVLVFGTLVTSILITVCIVGISVASRRLS
jgi:hypothetical protein